MKRFITILSITTLSVWHGCDSVSLPADEDPVLIRNLTVTPSEINFTPDDGARDTTLSIFLQAETTGNSSPEEIEYSLVKENSDDEPVTGFFSESADTNRVTTSVDILTSTTSFESWRVFVFGFNGQNEGEIVESSIRIVGISTSPPEIVEAFNTDIAIIPESGQEQIDFFARVVHPSAQSLIDRVDFFLIDQNGERLGGPDVTFEMFDDGAINFEQGLIDETAGDSLYSRALFINSENQQDNIDVFYFATDVSGLRSDTVQTSLEIRN